MAAMKLDRLPDRTPVKLTIAILPDLAVALEDYAALYEATYSKRETVADLIPYMLGSFLDSDRTFARGRSGK
jgi:hypothetical protein